MPTLRALLDDERFEVVAVVTQPDRPAGRGNKLHPPPTKVLAEEHAVAIFQPESLSKSPEMVEELKNLEPDYVVMVAFGQILRKAMLELPKKGVINIHASLLPKYRGAAPINWSIINGDAVTGITTMFTEAGVDTGPMLLKHEVAIGPETNAEELAKELSSVGAKLLLETILQLESGELKPQAQNHEEATLAPMMNKELGKIEWSQTASSIHNLVRGLYPWPGTFTSFRDGQLKIIRTKCGESESSAQAPGTVSTEAGKVYVACGAEGRERLELLEVQPANRGRIAAKDWANGVHLQAADVLGR